jgi:hypothetical protein
MPGTGSGWLSAYRSIGVVSLLGLCAWVSAPLRAEPTSPQSYDFDCDVPAGHFSEWDGSLPSHIARISGSIELTHREQDPRWAPVANVFLLGESPGTVVGLQLTVHRDNPTELEISVRDTGGKRSVIGSTSADSGPISFLLSVSKPGVLTLAAGGATQDLELGSFKITKLALSCSTGEFKYKSVVVMP